MDESQNSGSSGSSGRSDLSGRLLGRFLVKSRLGEGGMGQVYLAEDTLLKRLVALKRISPHLRDNPRLAERFRREVELASRLSHPHIAAVYDVFEHEGESFLVMEYVEGQTLRQRMHGAPISIEEFLEITRQAASALAAAHAQGVLHRDLKPENIILTRDHQVKILDFGLAKDLPLSAESTLAVTEPGLKGTPGYMAPEALLEKPVDARADLFSLGVVFYEMLAGRHPFMHRGDSFVTTVNRVLGVTPKPLSTFNREATPQIEAIVSRLLEKDPIQRYATAVQLGADLKAAAGGSGISSSVSAAVRPRRRSKLFAAVGIGVVVCAAAGFLFYRYIARSRLTTNDWILMTDFSNETKQPIFDDTVSQALRDAIEESRVMRLVPRAQEIAAARLMGERDVSRIDAPLGRQICQREGYRGLLTGSIRSLPPDYVVTVQLENPESGVPVYTTEASFRQPAQLYPAVDKLARTLRSHLGESLADIRETSTPLAQVTTPSLVALQRYTRAVRLYDQGGYPDALTMMQSALAADPNFAMAHFYLAQIDDLLGNVSAERTEMSKALAGIAGVSERERYLIQALHAEFDGDYAGAASKYRLLTELYPNDLPAWKGLGEAATYSGLPDQAIEAERRVLEISPDNGSDYARLIELLAANGYLRDAIATYQTAIRRGVESPGIHREAGIAYMVMGDVPAAAKQFELCAKSGGLYGEDLGSLYRAGLFLYQGKIAEAIPELQAGLILNVKLGSTAWTPLRRYLLADAYLAEGKRADAIRQSRALWEAANRLDDAESTAFAGSMGLRAGQRAIAQAALRKLKELRAKRPHASYDASCYEYLLGEIQLADGHPSRALATEFRAYAFYAEPDVLRVEGQAYAAAKEWAKAATAYQQYIGQAAQIFDYFSPLDWVLAHLDLARALARAGNRREAESTYDEFLKIWAGADGGLRAVAEARAERKRLTASFSRSSLILGPDLGPKLGSGGGEQWRKPENLCSTCVFTEATGWISPKRGSKSFSTPI